jgi:HSP20 family protein
MSISRWDPFQDLQSFRDEMNRTLGRWFSREEGDEPAARRWMPALDVTESKDAYHIDVEVPGMRPEDINVTVDQGMLTVQGERRSEEEKGDRSYHRVERRYGAFRRSISLPRDVDASRVQASYDNGVLRLEVPKAEGSQAKRIEVKQSSDGGNGGGTGAPSGGPTQGTTGGASGGPAAGTGGGPAG